MTWHPVSGQRPNLRHEIISGKVSELQDTRHIPSPVPKPNPNPNLNPRSEVKKRK